MSIEMTMRHIWALAGKRGDRVIVYGIHIHVIKKDNEQIRQSFDLHDPSYTQLFFFIQNYLWIRGYLLTYDEERTAIKIERAIHHPAWDPRRSCEQSFASKNLFLFLGEGVAWIQYHETHHCIILWNDVQEKNKFQYMYRSLPRFFLCRMGTCPSCSSVSRDSPSRKAMRRGA